MKKQGSILEFTEQRNKELMKAFTMALGKASFIDIKIIATEIVNTPCSRFWVSEERAASVIRAIRKNKNVLSCMRPTKREMFIEINKRVKQLRKSTPNSSLPQLVEKVVNSPAPKFYMKPRCAMEIIYKIKKGFYEKSQ